jgi:hypothetical protein
MPRKCFLFLAALAAVLLVSPQVRADDKATRLSLSPKDIEASLETSWYGLYFKNTKIGYEHSKWFRNSDGSRIIETAQMSLKMTSFGKKTEMTETRITEFDARPPYRLLRSERQQSDGKVKQTILVVAGPKGLDVTVTTGKDVQKKQVKAVDYTLEDALTADVWVRRGPKSGDKLVTREFDIEDLKTNTMTLTMLATKKSFVTGVPIVYHELEAVSEKVPVKGLLRCDSKGRTISLTLSEEIEMRRESEADARNTKYSADVFVLGMAKIDRKIGLPTEITGLVLEIPGKEGEHLKSASRQLIVANPSGTYTCKLGKAYAKPVKATDAEIKENLEETISYPISSPKVQLLLREALGDAATPQEKVKRITKFVHDFVTPSLEGSTPKLADLLERKAGDCKSYALLFNALARAAGIPSREIGGLMYVGDDVKAFGGHAWNEVVLDGYWVPIDASLNETEINATHVSFGADRDATKNMLATLGKLSFKLISVQHAK